MSNIRVEDLSNVPQLTTGAVIYISQSGNPYKSSINDLTSNISLTVGSGFIPTNPVNAIIRFTPNTGIQFFNFTTNLWHTLLCVNNPPTIAFDSGQI